MHQMLTPEQSHAALRRLTGVELRDEPGLWQAWCMEQQ